MSNPLPYLVRMLLFLAAVAIIAYLLHHDLLRGVPEHADPEQRDRRGPGDRHLLRHAPGHFAMAGSALAATLPGARAGCTNARRPVDRPSGADGRYAGRAAGQFPPVADGDPRAARRHRLAPRRAPRTQPLHDRPADLPRPARHFLGPARDDRRRRRRHRRHAGDRRRRRADVRQAEAGHRRTAQGHGDGVRRFAVRPLGLAGPGLPRIAGEPGTRPLPHRTRGVAGRRDAAFQRRPADRR
jgi:hypothetical protein